MIVNGVVLHGPVDPSLFLAAHATWRVPLAYSTTLVYLATHRPARVQTIADQRVYRTATQSRQLVWKFPPVLHVVGMRTLTVTVLRLSNRSTGIQLDGESELTLRPAIEKVPSGARTVLIQRPHFFHNPPLDRDVRDPRTVRKLVAWLDALPVYTLQDRCEGGPVGVPATTVAFRDASGRVVARALLGSGCGPISFTVRGRTEAPLRSARMPRTVENALR